MIVDAAVQPKVPAYVAMVAVILALLSSALFVSEEASGAKKLPAVIACFHKQAHVFSGVGQPHSCLFKGYRGRGKHFVSVPVEGIRWGGWGESRTRGSFGRHVLTGEGVRVFAYGLRSCNDGRYWYSRAIANFRGSGVFFELRLPVCGDPLMMG